MTSSTIQTNVAVPNSFVPATDVFDVTPDIQAQVFSSRDWGWLVCTGATDKTPEIDAILKAGKFRKSPTRQSSENPGDLGLRFFRKTPLTQEDIDNILEVVTAIPEDAPEDIDAILEVVTSSGDSAPDIAPSVPEDGPEDGKTWTVKNSKGTKTFEYTLPQILLALPNLQVGTVKAIVPDLTRPQLLELKKANNASARYAQLAKAIDARLAKLAPSAKPAPTGQVDPMQEYNTIFDTKQFRILVGLVKDHVNPLETKIAQQQTDIAALRNSLDTANKRIDDLVNRLDKLGNAINANLNGGQMERNGKTVKLTGLIPTIKALQEKVSNLEDAI